LLALWHVQADINIVTCARCWAYLRTLVTYLFTYLLTYLLLTYLFTYLLIYLPTYVLEVYPYENKDIPYNNTQYRCS